MRKIFLSLVLFLVAPAALAYIGPGAGISLVSSVLGILGAIFLGLFAILAWPIRRMLKRRKAAREGAIGEAADPATVESSEPAVSKSQD